MSRVGIAQAINDTPIKQQPSSWRNVRGQNVVRTSLWDIQRYGSVSRQLKISENVLRLLALH